MTMPWSHVDRMIPEYCDGRLSAEDAARVEAHLERCAACRCAADDFRFASALLTRLPVTKAPDSLWPETARAALSISVGRRVSTTR